jgi:hypothetical protein
MCRRYCAARRPSKTPRFGTRRGFTRLEPRSVQPILSRHDMVPRIPAGVLRGALSVSQLSWGVFDTLLSLFSSPCLFVSLYAIRLHTEKQGSIAENRGFVNPGEQYLSYHLFDPDFIVRCLGKWAFLVLYLALLWM